MGRARAQHEAYERCLVEAGCHVHRVPADDTIPDSVFVEDVAVVFDEVALMTRPGAETRRAEMPAIAETLGRYRPLRFIESPGTVDGGDVLVAGRQVFVGRSSRTNAAGLDQTRRLLAPFGYTVQGVDVVGCLHLKSAVTVVAENVLLMNRAWTQAETFEAFTIVDVDPREPFAANALRIGDGVIFPAAYRWTRERLDAAGARVRTVDVDELAKAEGGVTCCSLVFEA